VCEDTGVDEKEITMMTLKETLAKDVEIYMGDCLDVLPTLQKVDACVTDPPYGLDDWNNRGANAKRNFADQHAHTQEWDIHITAEHVKAMLASSKHQIIFGANHFCNLLPGTKQMFVWNKHLRDMHFSDCEIAWCSGWREACRVFDFSPAAMEEKREHPTQKPIKLMEWCITMLPEDVNSIIDPFMGSGTTGCAAVGLGKKFIGIERDQKYFDIARRRIDKVLSQPLLFTDIPE
jgi:DNA modification methylase